MDVTQLSLEEAKMQLRKYRILWVLDIVLLVLCIGCLTANLLLKNQAYHTAISVSPATDLSIRQEAYLDAISFYPNRADAYLLLLEAYREDGYFTKSESDTFLQSYNRNHNKLSPTEPQYADLHCTAGLMYLNSYEADISTKIRKAIPFLKEAKENMAENDPLWLIIDSYSKIGNLCQNYLWNTSAAVKETDPQKVQELVAQIEQMQAAFETQEDPDIVSVRLGFCVFACDLLYVQRDLLAATVASETVIGIIERIYETLPETDSLQSAQTKNLCAILLQDKMFYLDAIQKAYAQEGSV